MTLGVAEAARRLGMATHVRLAVDFEGPALDVFQHNFPEARCEPRDVRELFDRRHRASKKSPLTAARASGVDFLLGGPPCQGHSDFNNHSRRDDPRNALYSVMAHAAVATDAQHVVIENVPSVVHDKLGVVAATRGLLQSHGYMVAESTVDLRRLGVPQSRRRHVLLASQSESVSPNDVLRRIQLRQPDARRTVRWAIGDLADQEIDSGFDTPSSQSETNARRLSWLFDQDLFDLPDHHRPACHRSGGHTYKSVYGRLAWDSPAQTITTGFCSMGQGRYVHPTRRSVITPHEAARLQCFPDYYSFDKSRRRGQWARMIGNAVPPFLTLAIAMTILGPRRRAG
jgi:DNA (cytosine-5)-methyltransferase 1